MEKHQHLTKSVKKGSGNPIIFLHFKGKVVVLDIFFSLKLLWNKIILDYFLFESTLFNKHAMRYAGKVTWKYFFIFNKTSVWEVFIGVTHLIIMDPIYSHLNIRGEGRIYVARVNFNLLENKPKATCSCSTVQVKLISSEMPAFWQQKT